jgi:hypothetical protein
MVFHSWQIWRIVMTVTTFGNLFEMRSNFFQPEIVIKILQYLFVFGKERFLGRAWVV